MNKTESAVLEIRCASERDIRGICEFEKKARITEPDIWMDEFDAEGYEEKLKGIKMDELQHSKIVIAKKGDEIIGRCDIQILTSLMDCEKTGYIDWIYVLKDMRSEGIGKKLFDIAEEYFKEVGVSLYYAFTAENEEAQKFYHNQNRFQFSKREVAEKELK